MASGYDKNHPVGPRNKTWRCARKMQYKALLNDSIVAFSIYLTTTYDHACHRSIPHRIPKANQPWWSYKDATYGNGGGHDQVI